MALTFDEILATTLDNHLKMLENQFVTGTPLVNFLTSRNRMKPWDGGATIVEELVYGKNGTTGSYSRYDTLSVAPQDGITAAQYQPGQYAVSIVIDGLSEAQNSSDEAIIDLLEAKVEQATDSLNEDMDIMLMGDGTGNGGKDWNGLANVVDDTVTLGGIAVVDLPVWAANVVDAASAVRTDKRWRNAINTASQGNRGLADFGLTSQVLWEHYEESLVPQRRYGSDKEADSRFENLMFGGIPLFWSVNVDAGDTFFLSSKHLRIRQHPSNWFRRTAFKEPVDGDWKAAQIFLYGQLTTNNRQRHSRIINQTV